MPAIVVDTPIFLGGGIHFKLLLVLLSCPTRRPARLAFLDFRTSFIQGHGARELAASGCAFSYRAAIGVVAL